MSQHPELLADIEAFVARVEISEITLGRKALSDPHFVRDLRKGRRLWPETEAKVRKFMAEYVPPTLAAEAPSSQEAA